MLLLLAGPLIWLAALSIAAIAIGEGDLILYGLVIAGGSFVLGVVLLLPARARRLREEREPAHR